LYDYEDIDTDFTWRTGDIATITERDESGWMYALVPEGGPTNVTSLFVPENYFERLTATATSSSPSSSTATTSDAVVPPTAYNASFALNRSAELSRGSTAVSRAMSSSIDALRTPK
jgi:hypothetical protein